MEYFDGDDISEGSDFEEFLGFNADDLRMFEDDIIANEFDLADPIDRDLWVRHMFEDEDSDDDNEEFEGFESDWKTENYHHNRRSAFNRKPGVKVDLPADATPLQVFNQIVTEELWAHLVTETNNYSDQTRQTPARAKMARWSRVTVAGDEDIYWALYGHGTNGASSTKRLLATE